MHGTFLTVGSRRENQNVLSFEYFSQLMRQKIKNEMHTSENSLRHVRRDLREHEARDVS